ncbi:sugar transferase [Bacillus sp. SG-1]|uniref:sugar transferase n=1 Tax=Bacillus sp. SG-1 TaxID=161544 RepID=UPI00015432A6|nr:sugar transferase [Bacillus sp. SG-1]EDL65252.1 undecaprenyl-phosphate glucosephosphotransferase [Bacillus sp. SG-1]
MKKEKQQEFDINVPKQKYIYFKRGLDILIVFCLSIIIFPIFLIVTGLVYFFDGKPAIFKQVRTGRSGEPFTIYKLRTMKGQQAPEEYNYDWEGGVPDHFIFKSKVCPRTTKLGTFLRKSSLDEIPQLWNVLKGDMSIVGPRPEIPQITQHYNQIQTKRLLVKPGITGYAQIHGRSDITHGQKIAYDLYYIHHISLLLDIKIIGKTAVQVLKRKGSY